MLQKKAREIKKSRWGMSTKIIIVIFAIAIVMVSLGIKFYTYYVKEQITQESTSHLISTYNQVNTSFNMFAERNWNYLRDWDNNLQLLKKSSSNLEQTWKDFCGTNNWDYSDLYLFNEESQYITVSGETGTTDSIQGAYTEGYQKGEPMVTSYYSKDGIRKVVFALDLTNPIKVEGTTYTGLAVSYENATLESILTDNVYNGSSDCYIITGDGMVLLSLEPKTEMTEHIDNLYRYFEKNLTIKDGQISQVIDDMQDTMTGGEVCDYKGKPLYVVYQPVGISDWSIVGIIEESVVDANMKDIVHFSRRMIMVLGGASALAIILIIVLISYSRLRKQKREKSQLKNRIDVTEQLFASMAQIVDRFFVVNLEADTYEYHEQNSDEILYSQQGNYQKLLEEISSKYIILSDTEQLKLSKMLSREYLREVIVSKEDSLKFEYAGRGENIYKSMHVIPVEWDHKDQLVKVLCVSLDIGQKIELENMANTDGLTGLYNERYFSHILAKKEKEKQPFTLYYIDLNKFKPINDTYGHDVGDQLLKLVAKRLKECVREKDYVFRIGGDEFTIIVSADLSEKWQKEMVGRIKSTISKPYEIEGKDLMVTTSCGYATYPEDSHQCSKIRILADQRMYQDKEEEHRQR